MIPYFQFIHINLGPITIYVWGLFVALGILAAAWLANFLAKRYILSSPLILDASLAAIIGGFLGARIFHVIFYEAAFYLQNPLEVFYIWHGGFSSFGGFLGALAAVWIFLKIRHLTYKEFLPYVDLLTTSLWLGWGIGRIGCFLIHDHPGTLTNFIGAVRFPMLAVTDSNIPMPEDPIYFIPRHDLGLYESILGFILFGLSWVLLPRLAKKQWGLLANITWLIYAVARFGLDFLRATDLENSDARYGGLTPAQWGMLALIFALTSVLLYGRLKPSKLRNTK
ncbi:MAG: prolipoprotein diacylglyceryl transferase [Candidatus Magasanikbacteria bacterium]|nr:prolipoprotein diacylglyceryl transferase [Candidatus Magasanikbacteria bacterium]